MKGVSFLETSIVVRLTRQFNALYKESLIFKGIEKFLIQIKAFFRYIFFDSITEISEDGVPEILKNSKVVRWASSTYDICRDGIVNCANSSIIMISAINVKKELHFLPIKTMSLIVFIAVLVNILLSVLWSREITGLGLFLRGVLLFVGFCGIFSRVNWEELKKTSYFMRWAERMKQ